MFYKIKNVFVAALLLPMAFGCKRENPNIFNANPVTAAPATNKVQQWLKDNPSRQRVGVQKAGTTLPSFTLQWQNAKFDASARTHWVPATATHTKQAEGQPNTYLVVTENEKGQITGGQYIMVLPNTQKMGKGQLGFDPVALLGTEKPKGFSGALLYYDVQGQLTGSQVYEAGQIQPKATANLAARDEGQGSPNPNKVQLECGTLTGTSPCIEWYWQTYVNGVLLYEDYMFTTCCDGSGGGGGGTDGCQAQLDAMVAAGQVVTNSPITETTEAETNMEWTKRYSWVIFKAVSWGLVSYERAVLEKVYYPSSNQSLWEFKTFDHTSIGEFGMTAVGSYSHADLGATINKTKYSAYVQVDFSVTSKACTISVTNVYNANKKFVAPNQIQYVNRQGK